MKEVLQIVLTVALFFAVYRFGFQRIEERKIATNPGQWGMDRFMYRFSFVFAVVFFAGLFLIDFIFNRL